MTEIYFAKDKNKAIIFTGNYYAIFEGDKVQGKIEIQGLKVEFEGKVDKLPEGEKEAHEEIKSLFFGQPRSIKLGSIVEAENDKVKIKAWGITINDVNALFNKLSELTIAPIDVNRLSLQYDMPVNKVKKIVKENPLKLNEEALKYSLSTYGNRLPRVEEIGKLKVILDVSNDGGILILVYDGKQIYKTRISFPTLYKYVEMRPEELIEESFNLLEGFINLFGKAGDSHVLPGIVEGYVQDSKIIITSENEYAEIPGKSFDELRSFIESIRRELRNVIKNY